MMEDFVGLFEKCCGLFPKSVNLSFLSTSVLPAVATLCIVQVPTLSSRLRRLPFAVLSLLLLCAAVCSRLASTPVRSPLLNDAEHLSTVYTTNAEALAAASRDNTAALELALQQQQQQHGGHHPKSSGGMSLAAVPAALALFMVQMPLAGRARVRQSHAGLVAVLGGGILLQPAGVDAAVSMCAAVKPVCPMPAVSIASSAKAPTTPAITATAAAGARPSTSSSRSSSSNATPAAQPSPPPYTSSNAYTDSLLAAMGVRKEALHVSSAPNPNPGGDIPQRVMPTAPQPKMSKALEQQLFTQLLNALTQTAPPPPTPNATVVAAPGAVSPSLVAVASVGADDGLMYLSNSRLRVGMDPKRGGAITHLSSPVMPAEWANVNLINTWDSGRLVQQSYYGCEDGSCWSNRAWRWNPVQGGSWHNQAPKLLSSSVFGDVLSMSAVPRNWGAQTLLDDVVMTTQTRLLRNMVKLRMTMRYTGSAGHPARHQEVPAVFVDRRLGALAVYTGSKPWTGEQLSFLMPGQANEYFKISERWAAYVDMKSGFGVGVYTPIAEELVAYRVGPENSTAKSDCSYLAPIVTTAIEPNTELSYDTYIAVGRVDEIRQWFAALAATTQPTLSAQRRIAPASNARLPAPTPAQATTTAATTRSSSRKQNVTFAPTLPIHAGGSPSDDRHERRLTIDTSKLQGSSSSSSSSRRKAGPLSLRAVVPGLTQLSESLPELLAPMVIKPTLPLKLKVTVG